MGSRVCVVLNEKSPFKVIAGIYALRNCLFRIETSIQEHLSKMAFQPVNITLQAVSLDSEGYSRKPALISIKDDVFLYFDASVLRG